MEELKSGFIQLMIDQQVLKFGDFTLKSGRQSPYFFNMGEVAMGGAVAQLGQAYAQTILASGLAFDMLFGPAYKGIPLVTTTAIALSEARDVPYAFNRKETKQHGEGGVFVGAPIKGRVLIVDDVLTAGTAVLESKRLIEEAGAEVAGVVVAMDRREKLADQELTATQWLLAEHGLQVVSIVSLDDVIGFLDRQSSGDEHRGEVVRAVQEYRARYCVA